jgi:hypothetical protein
VLALEKVNYRVAIADDALVQQYGGIDSLPETLLIDREGRIAARHVGIQNKVEYAIEVDYVLGKT